MELVILIGLPGCGKSSFYAERFAQTYRHVSKDAMRGKRNKDRKQRVLLEEAALVGQSVVLDNTHPSSQSRAPWIAWAKANHWSVRGYYFSSIASECYERNAARVGEERVPDVGFYAIVKQLELPTYQEGFDTLYYVSQSAGQYVVQDWRDDEEQSF